MRRRRHPGRPVPLPLFSRLQQPFLREAGQLVYDQTDKGVPMDELLSWFDYQ
jgi:hypothetical protein